ncbi:MAG: hypothetical protein QME83_01415 [Thermodesulfobacteriota bacterium]|nr:hypothetical protein [Thermodesulfobacteriota bacterium]
MKNRLFTVVVLLMVGLGCLPETGMAGEDSHTALAVIQKTLAERFSWDLRILTYGIIQEPSNSSQNSENNFLQIPHYTADLEIRPDLRLNIDPLELSAKPRMRLEYSIWREGYRKGESEWDDDWYINEWLARWKVCNNLFISYGRENLQWGPSFLFSPSNPFFQDNGRRNPYLEVPGMDFGRLVWIPESSWTISFIANTDEGRNKTASGFPIGFPQGTPFKKTYALKIDYTGRQNYGSIIFSHREDSLNSLGFFGGWTISDAILLYGEGVITQGSKALYPKRDSSPFGASMQKLHQDDSTIKPVLLIGGSYTFAASGTLSMEYAYYSPGYSDADSDTYYSLRRRAAGAISSNGLVSALGQKNLTETANTGLRFLRKNYALFQYTQNNIKNKIDLTLRWTQNLNDGSGQFTTVVSYSMGNHLELFSVGTVMAGGKNTEFGSILDYQWIIGLKYSF